jgi:hypothetical protein
MKLTLIFFCLTLFALKIQAQKDWQQKIDYQINVKLDDKAHTLTGNETFVYHNNSPETLTRMFIHVWPNAYKDGTTALGKQLYNDGETLLTFGPDSVKGGIENLNFTTNGTPIPWQFDPENPDIVILTLDNPIPPGGQMNISTPFFVRIPSGEISRLGHVGQSYQITQWYPKPAVYDKNGWNPIPYLNQGEFYSDYGTFDVSITLPENYVLGATGDCQTPSEIDFLNALATKTQNNIDSYLDKKKYPADQFPASSETYKTVRYTQKDVHDFAWFADKRYLVLKGQVELPESKRMVTSWAMFTPRNANLWKDAIEYINDGTYYYSKWNGDYPYNNVTAVDGTISAGGGMEYPNITVIGNASNATELEVVIVHEVGHNWFYGILGSNERVHGWMDEGMNTLNELRYMYTKYPNNTNLSDMILDGSFHFDHLSHYDMADISFTMVAKLGEDQPIETHSADFTGVNYGTVMYMKTGLVFNYLKEYLGEELFDKCMHTYYETWKFKHPDPADMQAVFESVSERDLDWLFYNLIQTTEHLDAKLCSVRSKNGETTIKVANKGQTAGPIEVTGYMNGEVVKTEWVDPTMEKTTLIWPVAVDMVKVNASHREPEMNRTNDYWAKKGLLGKVEPLKLEFLIGDNEPDHTSTFWTPVIAGNRYDKLMLGVAVHNNGIPFKRFQYCVTPLYSFGGKRISGIAEFSIGLTPARNFKTSRFGISVKSFRNDTTTVANSGYYFALQPYWQAKIGNRKAASAWTSDLILQSMYRLDVLRPSQNELVGGYFKYNIRFNRPDHKLLISLRTDYLTNPVNGDAMGRNSIEIEYKFRYMRKDKGRWLELRHYTGGNYLFDFDHATSLLPYTLSLAGASGLQDLFLEDYFFGRSEVTGFNSQKRIENMGGFKSTSFYGTTSRYLSSFNFYIQSPVGPKIFGVFADYGLFSSSVNNKIGTAFNTGLALRVGNYFGVYFPVYSTQNLIDSTPGSGYGSRIRYTLKLNIIKQPLNLGSLI